MAEKKIAIKVSASLGSVSGKVIEAKKPIAVLVLAHGAGAGMDHPFMKNLSVALAEEGITTLRYNFLYMEHKRGRPDAPAVAMKAVQAAVAKAAELFPKLPLLVGGKSFGGRMSSHWVSDKNPADVRGLVFFGFPLHRPGAPSIERAEHLYSIKVPMLFLQGTRDTLADLASLKKVIKKLKPSTLVTFEGADHSFKAGKENLVPKLAETVSRWLSE
ncbi:MAG: alpha/beta hydrolase [Cyclobacteriaceae bacterium]|nr:alpha/beta hydrolase [Cyclobacteriaceae bacterium]